MKLFSLFAVVILPLTCIAAKKNSENRFEAYHSKSLYSSPLKLDDAAYEHLASAPRDYTVAVLLTALEARYGCQMCRDFHPEWELIAKSWMKGDRRGSNKVLYGTLDFADGKGTFQKLMLQTAPILLLFPPTTGPGAKVDGQPLRYDFTTGSQSAEHVYSWILHQLPEGPKPAIHRPFNYVRFIAFTTMFLGFISVFSVASPYILPIVQNRNLWAAISLIIILLFTSGHMFNHIRKVPYVSGDGKGGISYFAGGFSNQFGLETQIVAAMCMYATILETIESNSADTDGVLSFATIALALKVPLMLSLAMPTVDLHRTTFLSETSNRQTLKERRFIPIPLASITRPDSLSKRGKALNNHSMLKAVLRRGTSAGISRAETVVGKFIPALLGHTFEIALHQSIEHPNGILPSK
ncbi:oligosaccharyl transferase subunit ost3/OST6 [Varicellaria rhodocarpa]|nr:oligosaccharyl transferase subunit ost3/OST6 [Varicellaria rhodocarpa]